MRWYLRGLRYRLAMVRVNLRYRWEMHVLRMQSDGGKHNR